ncbi:MAG: LysM peptidoglycan-binding domain-containing protein [Lachnospiraceae bacterium]|nr:LysM peptidoglycan-binding domain-containing protein [Lachnospiraceae bacterium]
MIRNGKKWKKTLAGVAVAGMVLSPVSNAGIQIVFADDLLISANPTVDGSVVYDFKDGSIVPTDTDGKSDVTSADGKLTVKVGTQNAYQYNGAQHGVAFKAGNSVEIKVDGAVTVTVGDCQYSNATELTMVNAEGTWSQTVATGAGCQHNDGSAMVFHYEGGATTLILNFDNTAYVPSITVTPNKDVVTYDFRDGSIIPTDTDGKSDVTFGNMTVKVGTQNAYQYNGAQHGVAFKAGNSIEFKVDGPSVIEVGDCQYSNAKELTMTSADGSWTQTVPGAMGCQHNDGSVMVFKYDGEATTLTLNFDNTAYVPSITVKKLVADVPDENGVPKDSVFMYNFPAGDVLVSTEHTADNQLNGTATSKDGFLSVVSAGSAYFHDMDHGLAVTNGDKIEVKVAGDAVITLLTCQYGGGDGSWVASTTKGEIVSETKQPAILEEYDGQPVVFKYEGVATTLTFTLKANDGEFYLHGVNVANLPEKTETPAMVGNGKIDVWDFGGEQLDPSRYNNMLTADMINSWYDDSIAEGTSGNTLKSFATEDVMFNSSGKTNNRLRTTNTAVTRYDDKNKVYTAADGTQTTLNGFVYSNSASTSRVWVGVKLYEGDILTAYTSSNGGMATVTVETPSGKLIEVPSDGSQGAAMNKIYAAETGIYRLYCLDEKLVVCRLEREHTAPVLVSGKIEKPETLGDYTLIYTNNKTGEAVEVKPEADGSYEVWLRNTYDYTVSLGNANGYVVTSDAVVEINVPGAGLVAGGVYEVVPGDMLKDIAKRFSSSIWELAKLNAIENPDIIRIGQKLQLPGAETSSDTAASTVDVTVEAVDLVSMTGKITGLGEDVADLKLSFVNEDMIYVPELTIEGDTITAQLERGVTYDIVAENVNDYYLSEAATISLSEDKEQNIVFAAKPVYEVALETTGIEPDVWANAAVTFTNINEAGYSYTFTPAAEKVALRDGQYKVTVSGVGSDVAQKMTADVKVNGADTTAKIAFEALSSWDFAKLNKAFGGAGIETIGENKYCSGLELVGSVQENKTYLLLGGDGAAVKVPVKAGQKVTVNYCYCASFNINGEIAVDEKSGSTSQIDTVVYTAKEDGFVTINGVAGTNANQTYFTSIDVTTPVEYKEVITVGADKEYQSINAALDAVEMMERTEDQRVTIEIDPGNYEEMLVIDMPNITLKNAAGEKASLAVTNKGVDIDENAVRITSYYGHGYSYYSMGPDCKYDAELLEVNKANGSYSFKNPGSGSTSGSYWNATVVVYADGFQADGIIFENSFNQYISKKEANDIVVMESGNKGERPTTAGDTSVQNRDFVERAGALSIASGTHIYFNNCKFIGRQDTLYGQSGSVVAFNECDILGAVDYIYGGMTAVFSDCNLMMNTSEKSSDAAYLTAAQQAGGRGFLFWNCNVTSTTPGVDTASEYTSKPGYFGRPWQGTTSEAVFVNTTVQMSDAYWGGTSLISPIGWMDSLGGPSSGMYEYGTVEASGENNSAARAEWSTSLTELVLNDGTDISTREKAFTAFLGDWMPFDLTKAEKKHEVIVPVKEEVTVEDVVVDLTAGLTGGVNYDGISVLEDMASKGADSAQEIEGVAYANAIAGSNNASPKGGAVPTEGAAVKVTPAASGKFTIVLKLNSGKQAYFVDGDANVIDYIEAAETVYLTKTYEVEEGKTYYFYGQGTKPYIYFLGLDY